MPTTSANTRPALDREAAVALIVPWPWQVRTRTPLSRGSICPHQKFDLVETHITKLPQDR